MACSNFTFCSPSTKLFHDYIPIANLYFRTTVRSMISFDYILIANLYNRTKYDTVSFFTQGVMILPEITISARDIYKYFRIILSKVVGRYDCIHSRYAPVRPDSAAPPVSPRGPLPPLPP